MGIPSDMRDAWINRRKSVLIPSPHEEDKLAASKRCTQEGVRAGAKAGAIACVIATGTTLLAVRVLPWAKHNLNYTGQALVISAASISTYFITVDKTILACARKNAHYQKSV